VAATPKLEFSPDPLSDTTPTWTDITSDLMAIEWWNGKSNDLDEPQAGGMACRLKNTNRRFEPEYVAGEFYPGIDTERRFRLSFDAPSLEGLQFWGDFEQGADGTAPEWTSGGGGIDAKAGAEARQLQYVATPTPRLGSRIARVEVASGDQFGASTGERMMLRRGSSNDAWPLAAPEGRTVRYQFSFRPLAPWTHPTGWEIFQQFKAEAAYGQPIVALTTDAATKTKFDLSFVTGDFPNAGAATAGTGSTANFDFTGPTFAADVWWDVRYTVKWSHSSDGFFVWEMKQSTDTNWTTYGNRANFQTLPSTAGVPSTTLGEQLGFYRNASAHTNVVFHDGYQVGVTENDVGYGTQDTTDPTWNSIGWENLPNLVETQGGNPSFEATTSGASTTGGGITISVDPTRSKFGAGSLKIVTDGSGSSQGVRHFKLGGATRFDVTAGLTYTASAWFSSDTFETVRLEIEYFDAGSVSLGVTQALSRSTRTTFRRHWVTTTAPVGAVTARIGTRWSGTTASTFWVDGVALWQGTYPDRFYQGLWYAEDYDLEYPARTTYSEVTVTCVDGMGLLAADALPTLDPPDASSYEDVVTYDQPWGYWQLGEPEGTKVVSHVRYRHGGKWKGENRRNRRYRTHNRVTKAEVEGTAGPSGTYKNLPTLGEPGLILGDPGTSVRFARANTQYARIPLDSSGGETLDGNRLTVEAWVKLAQVGVTHRIVIGPLDTGGSAVWELFISSTGDVVGFTAAPAPLILGTTSMTVGPIYHIAVTFTPTTQRLYLNGVLDKEGGTGTNFPAAAANPEIIIGSKSTNPPDAWLAHVAIYEKALEPDTILDHYQAGAQRGYASQLTGARIAAIASSPLWSTSAIEPGSFTMQPTMQYGQGKLDEIVETVQTERPRSQFYFDGVGNPIFRDFDSLDGAPSAGTFGDATGETPYADIDLLYDNEVFNTVTGSIDGGRAITVTDATSVSDRKPKTRDDEVGLPLMDDDDVRTVVSTILAEWKTPTLRPTTVTIQGADTDRISKILHGTIGSVVRVKRRGTGGTAIDRQSVVLGYRKSYTARERVLACTFNLSRGFNAALGGWHLGTTGFDELGTNTVLA
jgi:hypothetical protein